MKRATIILVAMLVIGNAQAQDTPNPKATLIHYDCTSDILNVSGIEKMTIRNLRINVPDLPFDAMRGLSEIEIDGNRGQGAYKVHGITHLYGPSSTESITLQ